MSKCAICTLATASTDGEPSASTVYFKNAGTDIYFNTGRDTQKVRNITLNPRVAIAMQEVSAPKTDQEIKGIQYIGKARILSDADITEVPKAVVARHRAFNSSYPGTSVIVKVTPIKIYLIDYSHGFRHRDVLQF
jgi:nitroimidazol reductase NimA-like FMN-containing flavoprotein (pyridoxamine 5'-phosphate oxidase superfamily)